MNVNGNEYYPAAEERQAETLGRYTAKTFGWMFAGLLMTFAVAMFGYVTGYVFYLFMIPYFPMILLLAEVGVVIYLSARIEKMSVGTARAMFFVYAALNGVVFSSLFLIYQLTSLVLAFGACSLFFGIMAALGYTTNADFSRLRPFMLGGLIFLAAFWILSIFINLSQFETAVCALGIFLFLVITAYDTKKIRLYHQVYSGRPEIAAKASIFAALELYLDFINLFLYLIRITGKRK
ncbi:MAG TPA: Bax inhibitor-1/YccA family protein [Candidatus Lachnoclostridium pullistercoris]|uniref:Bax inhibitor-1/YccA family protein n=1 Tax=Candidatus Lachnoclostridium pullistercoris TaxID=2838632 RepID=A0A9D2PBZ9_9FIRM|nr:Bax inhibitor-1/YccA family protein [Candidatus Lachnoclostridium pullistercoris]